MSAERSFNDSVPGAVVTALRAAARTKGLIGGDSKSELAAFRRLAVRLFPPETVTLPHSQAVGTRGDIDPRRVGEIYWRGKSLDQLGQRHDGRYYTPNQAIDRILALVWDDIFPGGRFADATVCDPSIGCGFFFLRLLDLVRKRFSPDIGDLRAWGESALYGVDKDPGAVFVARACLWLSLSDSEREFIPDNIRCGDALLGEGFSGSATPRPLYASPGSLDWRRAFPRIAAAGGFDAIIGNPPYEILTNFDRYPERRELASAVRGSGLYLDSLGGQINLYRLFIERSLSLLRDGGALSMIVPASLARDTCAGRLRRRLLFRENADDWLLQREKETVFAGVTQATCVFRARKNWGPAELVRVESAGLEKMSPLSEIAAGDGAIPYPDDRAGELAHALKGRFSRTLSDVADIRVGEVDQTVFRDCMRDDDTGCLLARGAHLRPFLLDVASLPSRARFLDRDLFLQRKGGQAQACRDRAAVIRIAQLGIRNMQTLPRLVAALIPPGVYLGNSLNAFIPESGADAIFLSALLNSRLLDRLFRSLSGNNNINLCEVRGLPFPDELPPGRRRRVRDSYRACEAAAASNGDVSFARRALDAAVYECYALPAKWRSFLEHDG
ncbi:MAG: Eco57I restriction-modification methylase domain-containing protein [Planctomycetota bacterium]|nr:Eco57I restriction-modification methylase domain-containing protein [Planctomycetota bacterium]